MESHHSTDWRLIAAFLAALAIIVLFLFPRCAEGKSLAAIVVVSAYGDQRVSGLPEAGIERASEVKKVLIASGYDVNLLVGSDATKAGIENLFFRVLPAGLTKDDILIVYLDCLAVGGDFDDPYLLPWDANPDDITSSGLEIRGLLGSVGQASLIVMTSTTHAGFFENVSLIGPLSRHWAEQVPSAFVLSVVPLGFDIVWSDFGTIVANGFGSSADVSGDGNITLAELRRYLESQVGLVTNDRVRVDVAGDYDPTKIVAAVTPATVPVPLVQPPALRKRQHQALVWSFLGSGLAFGASSAVLYAVGQSQLDSMEPDEASKYETVRAFQFGASAASGVSVAIGAGLLVFRF